MYSIHSSLTLNKFASCMFSYVATGHKKEKHGLWSLVHGTAFCFNSLSKCSDRDTPFTVEFGPVLSSWRSPPKFTFFDFNFSRVMIFVLAFLLGSSVPILEDSRHAIWAGHEQTVSTFFGGHRTRLYQRPFSHKQPNTADLSLQLVPCQVEFRPRCRAPPTATYTLHWSSGTTWLERL